MAVSTKSADQAADLEGAGEVVRTLYLLKSHPSVLDVGEPYRGPGDGTWAVDILVQVLLPNGWMAQGKSPNGVLSAEPVTLRFDLAYPLMAPAPVLRMDFDRALAHVMPGSPQDPPIPCLYDGNLSELLQQRGLLAFIDQLVAWLIKAALGTLVDPAQGWEPVRRDSLLDFVVADSGKLRAAATSKGGYRFHRLDFVKFLNERGVPLHCQIGDEMTLSPATITSAFDEKVIAHLDLTYGRGVAIVVWPGKDNSGKPFISDKYQPETVVDLGGLKARAAEYGCAAGLRSALDWLSNCVSKKRAAGVWPVTIVLMARRPFPLIGTAEVLEICPYLTGVSAPALFPAGDATTVSPTGHHEAVVPALLRRMAGDSGDEVPPAWTLLGAGSVGSKLAMHLARAGRAPNLIVDKASMTPHNAARHALIPASGGLGMSWMGPKALALAEALEGLGPKPKFSFDNIATVATDQATAKRLLSPKTWAAVNATASLVVRQALAMAPVTSTRIIETALMAQGSVGLLTVEGPKRNPDTAELFTEMYELTRQNAVLQKRLFGPEEALKIQRVGDGCGTMTMAMSDATISAMVAPMATIISELQAGGLPENGGEVILGALGDDKISISWTREPVAPYIRLLPEDGAPWRVKLSERACKKIDAERARWPGVETGGILLGSYSETGRSFIIVDVMDAPADSSRSPNEFVLGKEGVRAALKSYAEETSYCLYSVGTWHSHLADVGPSPKDKATAMTVAIGRVAPSVLLIRTPKNYRAVVADGAVVSDMLDEDKNQAEV